MLLVLQVLLAENYQNTDLLRGAPACSKTCLFFGNDLFSLRFQSVQYYPQHDFAWMTDEAYCAVVLAQLKVSFLGKSNDQRLCPRCRPFSSLPDLVADVCEDADRGVTPCLDQFCWNVIHSWGLAFLQ